MPESLNGSGLVHFAENALFEDAEAAKNEPASSYMSGTLVEYRGKGLSIDSPAASKRAPEAMDDSQDWTRSLERHELLTGIPLSHTPMCSTLL